MPYVRDGVRSVKDGYKPQPAAPPIKMPQPVKIPPPGVSKGK